ncbi:MAG: hypothetical protein KY468_02165 [Armatimonadetes bacterium]|nr:hypothetical protein [Armatimonadota bacterium]
MNSSSPSRKPRSRRIGQVRLRRHSLVDNGGPFLGLGSSYFTALWRCKNDRERLESDLAFLSEQDFNYIRILSMVGWYAAWEGREIAPVRFTSREGKTVEAWPDYWRQLQDLIDIAYDRYGLRTQITLFADAQLMPEKSARIAHMKKVLSEVVPGREHKIIMLEVANEAWQNGFPGESGVADLREFTRFLAERTDLLVATTSNHEDSFTDLYADSVADIATWHFSRDKGADQGWKPVYDPWELGRKPGFPPVSSNEPIGPGSSVNAESDPIKLVMAAAFAYVAGLPMYVFHSEAGVFGKTRFEEMSGIRSYRPLLNLLPGDVASWERNDGKESESVFTAYAGGQPNRYWTDVREAKDGCIRNIGTRKGSRFVHVPIGIQPEGLLLEARHAIRFQVYHPLTGKVILNAKKSAGERFTLPPGPGAYLIKGTLLKK